ncbi:MAG: prepilin-type N-terminal cleavage/methylation domain-containing protein [Patescibacteria group bacterium]|nr:prepilin-type N-terminal cleavage/methylation domain-containing protein [Patescibacteria group bacterium]MDE2015025.1 prepilin-type N-terminal cleavage/methylation domain-containing protein [Patescibacteria group bacterium]MDE2226453.1 prepilin-type N-terminal cleavage/methylation domain-containing protein [Patescibacteria group bacterium]
MNATPSHESKIINSRGSGFTLIELLVVVGIIAMMSSMVISYSSSSRNQLILSNEEAGLVGFIFKAKSLAITTRRNDLNVPCGYGVRMDYVSGVAHIFSYAYGCNQIKDGYIMGTGDQYSIGGKTLPRYTDVSTTALPSQLKFLYESSSPKPPAPFSVLDMVFFLAPVPDTFIAVNNNSNSLFTVYKSGVGTIYLQTADGSSKQTINVSAPLGQINF